MSRPSASTASGKRSPAWWAVSLAFHAALIGLLLLLFPYEEFMKPKPRAKVQPLVSQKVFEATTKRIEEKQAGEMARKLRELRALTADIQSVEVNQRASHADFVTTITKISPELAGSLNDMAQTQFAGFLELKQADETAWSEFQTNIEAAEPVLRDASDPALPPALVAFIERAKDLARTQDKLNFAQAGLLDIEQQIAGRLGFLKDRNPGLVEQQGELVAAWANSMALGATYTGGFPPLQKSLSDAIRTSEALGRSLRPLEERQMRVAESESALAERRAKAAADEDALGKATAELIDPADKNRVKDRARQMDTLKKDLKRSREQLAKEESRKADRVKSLRATEEDVRKRTLAVAEILATIPPLKKALMETRQPYLAEMQRAIDLHKSLAAEMAAALARPDAPPSASTPEPGELP